MPNPQIREFFESARASAAQAQVLLSAENPSPEAVARARELMIEAAEAEERGKVLRDAEALKQRCAGYRPSHQGDQHRGTKNLVGKAQTSAAGKDPILLTETEAAKLLGFAPKTLQGWRTRGHVKLPFVRISRGCVRYRRSDIDAWLEEQLRTSTSDDTARGLVLRERKKDRRRGSE